MRSLVLVTTWVTLGVAVGALLAEPAAAQRRPDRPRAGQRRGNEPEGGSDVPSKAPVITAETA